MRILIFLLALISAFFVSKSYANNNYVPAKNVSEGYCTIERGKGFSSTSADCKAVAIVPLLNSPKVVGPFVEVPRNSLSYFWKGSCAEGFNTCYSNSSVYFTPRSIENPVYECPPDGHPNHTALVENQCYIPNPTEPEPDPEKDPDCPDPTDNDPFVFGSGGGQTSVCFPAGNGRQCEIKTDANGGYYIPVSYGSAEPTTCVPDPDPEPEPEPEPTPDPEKPDDKDDPTPTPDPDNPEPPKDADDSDQTDILDAVNQVNDNLNVINDNMNLGIETHTERLDRMAKETQNSNELLGSIKQNTASTTLNTGKTILEIGKTNTILEGVKTVQTEGLKLHGEGVKLLDEIKENTEPEKFNFSAGRKQGGLNGVFTDADIQQVKTEIEEKRTELTDYLETIKTESATLFDIDPNLSSDYEERLKTIKGVEVDLGVSRFSNFFKLIAPAILLAATLTGLYILLGSNRE